MGSRPRYRLLSHTADVAVRVYAASLADIYANAAVALTSLWVDNPRSVRPLFTRSFDVDGLDRDDLLVRWLSELIYTFDTEGFIGREFRVPELDDRHLRAQARGEFLDLSRHHPRLETKAATYHALEIRQELPDRWTARVVFDI